MPGLGCGRPRQASNLHMGRQALRCVAFYTSSFPATHGLPNRPGAHGSGSPTPEHAIGQPRRDPSETQRLSTLLPAGVQAAGAHATRSRPRPPQAAMPPPPQQQPPHRHAKTDSEVTSSMAASSPPRAAYYVQSPSHDDGENKTAASSFHSSPAASPPRSASRHSSSSSRFSASAKGTASGAGGGRRRGSAWAKEAAIEEEGLLGVDDGSGGDGDGRGGIPRRARYLLGFAGAFLGLFLLFALVLWGASRNQRPVVALRAVTFHRFVVQAGTDASLVPTEMASLNATVSLTFRNVGTFFGVHVSADPVTLHYAQLQLASGNMKYFYQPRRSQRSLAVAVVGDKVPLYGGGAGLSSTPTTLPPPRKRAPPVVVPPPPVPLRLAVRVRSRAFVLGSLVKPKFYSEAQCSVTMDQARLGKPVSLNKACTYTH
uniref:Late embryogenesis abundant protein LEA-2 subgroup domain-containing protein n=3 Tax=Zea mays TaxID=4577 RepID=A0A804RLA0_MAIZE